MRIAIDAMGGDYAPGTIVAGAVSAAREAGIPLLLVGAHDEIQQELAAAGDLDGLDLLLREAPDVVSMDESPTGALRRKRGASIRVAAEAVAGGEADALFSAGHTGATVVVAHGVLGMAPGVDRPALATTIPTIPGHSVLLDAGATVDCRPQHLVQFAHLGVGYARVALGVAEPRVGLLSIGEEESKGSDLVREAHQLLKSQPLRFLGNIEARDIFTGQADVIVCDGFTGNIALKVSEGLADAVERLLIEELSRTVPARFGALLAGGAYRALKRRVDYSEYGAAPLLGVNGLCLVGHGRSSAQAVRSAILLAARLVRERFEPGLRAGAPTPAA
jgi:glycerol-3-phosphate acyltransferase PlsX